MKQFFKIFFGSFFGAFFGVAGGFLILIAGLGAIVSMMSGDGKSSSASQGLKKDSVIVVDLARNIREVSNDNFFSEIQEYNLHDLREALEEASGDDHIQGVLIKMTSGTPMGWSTAKELRKIFGDFAESKKRLVAFGETADEKSLYVSSVAKKIYMHPTGEIKWNGFAAVPMFYKGFFDKWSLKPVIFKSGKFKSAIEPFTQKQMSEASRQQTEELLEDLWEETLDMVATSRGVDLSSLREFAEEASVRTAKKAQAVGLIDGLSNYSNLVESFLQKKDSKDKALKLKKKDLKRIISVQGYKTLKEESLFAALEEGSLFTQEGRGKNRIAILALEGSIMPGKSGEGTIGSDSVVKELQKMRLDSKIKGVVLRINSPGGSALASDVMWHEIERLKKVKPVYVSMGDVAASGGYYIAAGANKIFADVNTITGSIGVFSIMFNVGPAFESNMGVTFDRVVTNKYSDLGSGVRDMDELEKEIFQNDVTRIYKTFLGVVEKGRSYTSFSDVEMVAQGRVWSGSQAKEVGLVDQLGGLEDCTTSLADELKLEDYTLDFYPKKKVFGGTLNSLFGLARTGVSLVKAAVSPVEAAKYVKKSLPDEQIYMLSPYNIEIN